MKFLESNSVYLKKLSAQDNLVNYLDMVNDKDNVHMITGLGKTTLDKEDLKNVINNYNGQLFGIYNPNDQHVGNIGLSNFHQINRSCSFGIIMSSKYKKQGYALEGSIISLNHAFQNLNIHRVYLDVVTKNIPAIKLYDKLGFVFEGRMREAYWNQGQYHDLSFYSLLKNDFRYLSVEGKI